MLILCRDGELEQSACFGGRTEVDAALSGWDSEHFQRFAEETKLEAQLAKIRAAKKAAAERGAAGDQVSAFLSSISFSVHS